MLFLLNSIFRLGAAVFLVSDAKNRATPLITTGLLSIGLLRECEQLGVQWQCVSARGGG
jgi:hypothetical protein